MKNQLKRLAVVLATSAAVVLPTVPAQAASSDAPAVTTVAKAKPGPVVKAIDWE